jgi:hypothetical protein
MAIYRALPARHALELQHDLKRVRYHCDVLLAFGGLPEQLGKLAPGEVLNDLPA